MADQQREKYLKKAKNLLGFNCIYDTIEVAVSLTAGSAALIGWGLDSTIEIISAGTVWWRLNGELKGISEKRVKKRKKNHPVRNCYFFSDC